MQREFGGYLPLELPHGQELYTGAGVLRLNCGRNAIVAALRDAGAKKVYLPYYNCNTVYDAVTRAGFAVERYPLDARRLPVCPALGDGEWLLYVNYFGIASDDLLAEVKRRWPRVIFDNTQAFFSAPRMDADSYNVYSCRKFVGVPDGAYLVHTGLTDGIYPADTSWQHAAFLFRCIDESVNSAYGDSLDNESRFDGEIRENWDHGFHYIQHTNYNSVMAVPSDMYVQGYDGKGVAKLRLWQAKAPDFDMSSFSLGNYNTAMSKNASAELISKVLYPNDNHIEGKILRLRQQYFLSAASIGDIVQNHLSTYGTLENLADKVAIQLNDTHPTLAIPEMMRILLDECGFDWDKAFEICQKVFAYTNHTVMAEALEKWNVDIFKMTLPRIYQIVVEMNRRAREELEKAFPGDEGKINYMALIGDNQVRMANICAYTANSINGVSKLHSEIIKESVFHDYYLFKPQAFKNVTNGIAYRRWLLTSNPELCKLLDETIGEEYKHDASNLSKLNKYADDKTVLKRINEIKLNNKKNFAAYLEKSTGQVIDPNSIFDCQVKRMHEYKRQHLNALNIAAQYLYLKENPNADFIPKTYIFGAKAAPGYYMAKQMIRMICKLGDLINNDPAVRDKLRVVYLEEYCVSLSEHLMPAAEVSEQISLAGTEASGTGNMKFMLNGAITLGTLDGANVEIADAAGKENELIFGMLTPEVNNLKQVGYHPSAFIMGDDVANAALNFLERGWNGEDFHEVTENLRTSDPYMVMADFKDYRRAQADLQRLYADREKWAQMSLKNTANSGIFSADRSVLDYARDIWHASAVK